MRGRLRPAGLCFALALLAAGCDWSMLGYDATRSGYSPETTLTPTNVGTLTQKWTAQLPSTAATDPVVAGGKVFASSSPEGTVTSGALQAFDAAGVTNCAGTPVACSPLWSVSFPPGQYQSTGSSLSTPSVSGSTVYVGTFNLQPLTSTSGIDSYVAATGAPASTSSPGSTRSPALVGGSVFASVTDIAVQKPITTLDYLRGFDATSGVSFAATEPATPPTFSAPAVANGVMYAIGTGLDAFDAHGVTNCSPSNEPPSWVGFVNEPTWCAPIWKGTLTDSGPGIPAVANGSVYVAGSGGTVSVFPAAGCGTATCSPTWSAAAGTQSLTSPAVAGSALFVGSADGNLYAFPSKGCGNATCAATWTASLGSAAAAVSVAGSVVFVTTADGHLEAFNSGGCGSSTCNPLVSIAVGNPVRTAPAVSSGRVFVTDTTGTVHAYGLGS